MLDKLWVSTEEVVRERLSSPVLVPFVVSWIGWNYKFLVVLFSSVGVPRVFDLISRLYPTWCHYVFPGFLFPLATAALLVFVVPHLERWILEKTLGTQREVLDLKRDHANATKLTLAESR